MSAPAGRFPLFLIAGAALLVACIDVPTDAGELLSFQFNPLPSPAVVAGDTLRDSAGVVAPISVTAFDFLGGAVSNPPVHFVALDRGIRVDSLTGIVIGDSARATPARVLVTVKGFSGTISIPVALRPDTVVGANAVDSLAYSLVDTTLNVSNGLGVKVHHGAATADSAVASFAVSFRITSPADTALARLVNENGARSSVDTTDASGTAQRRIRLNVTRLTAPNDSIIAMASVKYRGAHVRGSPVRLVLRVKPR